MLTKWQESIFEWVANKLPFIRSQPLSTFSMSCILGDGTYIFNGKIGSVFDLGLGTIHPSWLLTAGGILALLGHIILLANAERVDQIDQEHGVITQALKFFRKVSHFLVGGIRLRNPFLLGFGALALNGLVLMLSALQTVLALGIEPASLLQLSNGMIITLGLGAAALSRTSIPQKQRDKFNILAPKLLIYATAVAVILGILALAPFMLLGGLLFLLGNTSQHYYALRMQRLEG